MSEDIPFYAPAFRCQLPPTSGDPVVESVRARLLERSLAGQRKYGVTLARQDLLFDDWLVHLQEELMDGILYIERTLQEYRKMLDNGR